MKACIIRKMATKVNLDVQLSSFTAFKYWIGCFKKFNGLLDTKITKFVTERHNNEKEDREVSRNSAFFEDYCSVLWAFVQDFLQ